MEYTDYILLSDKLRSHSQQGQTWGSDEWAVLKFTDGPWYETQKVNPWPDLAVGYQRDYGQLLKTIIFRIFCYLQK